MGDGSRFRRNGRPVARARRGALLRPVSRPRAGAARLRAAARRGSRGRGRRRRRDLPGRLAAPRRGAARRGGAALALRRRPATSSPTRIAARAAATASPSGCGTSFASSSRPAGRGRRSALLEAMAGLGEADRELLMLIGWEELTPTQAAQALGISSLAARTRLHRARRRLRARLAEQESSNFPEHGDRSRGGTMSSEKIDREMRAANPVAKLEARGARPRRRRRGARPGAHRRVRARGRAGGSRAGHLEGMRSGCVLLRRRRRPSPAAAAVFLLAAGAASESPAPAYGAELVRFAESTPLLLLEGPGWRVQNVTAGRAGDEGRARVDGIRHRQADPVRIVRITRPQVSPRREVTGLQGQRESGMFPPAVRQRRVELSWRHGARSKPGSQTAHEMPHPHGQGWIKLPVLETTARWTREPRSTSTRAAPATAR